MTRHRRSAPFIVGGLAAASLVGGAIAAAASSSGSGDCNWPDVEDVAAQSGMPERIDVSSSSGEIVGYIDRTEFYRAAFAIPQDPAKAAQGSYVPKPIRSHQTGEILGVTSTDPGITSFDDAVTRGLLTDAESQSYQAGTVPCPSHLEG